MFAGLKASEPTAPKAMTEIVKDQFDSGTNIAKALQKTASAWFKGNNGLSTPWLNIPRTAFNEKISGARRFVAQSWDLDRIKKAGKAYAISFLTADLATNIGDPKERMHAIQRSVKAGKEQLNGMTKKEIGLYTILAQSPLILTTLTGTGSKFPAFSTVISNVPGPRNQMYLHGSKLDGIYPASIPFEGFAVNFTVVSNCGRLDFGITACRKAAPQLQRLIDYLEDALVELEEAVGIAAPKSAKSNDAKSNKANPTAKTKSKVATLAKAKASPKKTPLAVSKTASGSKPKAKPKRTATVQSGLKKKKGPPRKVADK